ncbi:MAG TPA: sigma-70 family RNA polymerase sigma factor [Kineosporiaceae bacterium]|nr:sigma-70 family RNA polymerase sigma factor [Kineosporiaceae bacterium]
MLRGPQDELPDDVRAKFRAQDVDALAAVYDRYRRPVWSVTLRATGVDHLAQEALQDTFIRAWQAAGSYDLSRPLGPWLMTIARRTSLDLLRREFRPTRGGHAPEQDAVVEAPGIDEAWLTWEVQEALAQLSEEEREIIRLSFFEDLTQTQVAERLGIPLGTVKSRSHRAHRRLAELLAHVRDDQQPQMNQEGPPRRTASGTDAGRVAEGSEQR